MTTPNDALPPDLKKSRALESPAETTRRLTPPPVAATRAPMSPIDAAKAAASEPGVDSLKSHMPAGELGVRNPPGLILSTASGGTSKAEDTTRAAGYVADLTKTNEPPPGPPVAKEPSNFAGPEAETVPPVKRAPASVPGPGPKPPLPDPQGSDPTPRPTPPPTPANPVPKPNREPDNPADPTKNPAQVGRGGTRGATSAWPPT